MLGELIVTITVSVKLRVLAWKWEKQYFYCF